LKGYFETVEGEGKRERGKGKRKARTGMEGTKNTLRNTFLVTALDRTGTL